MALKMETPKAKEEYQKRKIVEQPFGNIKYNMKYIEFLTRGLNKIEVEKDLLNSVNNLKLIWNKNTKNTNKNNQIKIQRTNNKNPKSISTT